MGVRSSAIKKLQERSLISPTTIDGNPIIYNADGSVASPSSGEVTKSSLVDANGRGSIIHEMDPRAGSYAFEEFETQAIFSRAVFSGEYKFLLFGGAIRGGKTYVAMAIVFVLCKVFPNSRWAIVRKSYTALRRNTLPAFNKLRPQNFIGPVNYSTWSALCKNGSEIIFMPESIKEDPDLNRFRGLEVNGFLPEEMNELEEQTFFKMVERAGTWIVPRRVEKTPERDPDTGRLTGGSVWREVKTTQPPTLIIGTCNPAMNWVKRKFYDPWRRGDLQAPYFFQPSNPRDNPYLPEGYVDTLESVLPENEKKRFLYGDWSVADEPDQLIKMDWIIQANNVEHVVGRNSFGVDIARFGDDMTVLCLINGNRLMSFEEYAQLRTTRIAQILRHRMRTVPVDASNTKVDVLNMGAGVVDDCVKHGFNVVEVIAGGKPYTPPKEKTREIVMTRGNRTVGLRQPVLANGKGNGQSVTDRLNGRSNGVGSQYVPEALANPVLQEAFPYRFYDLRTQMYWTFARRLEENQFYLPEGVMHPKAIEDLTAIKYEIRAEKVLKIESKEEIFKRIGRSTDYGDALVMAAFDLPIPQSVRSLPQTGGSRILRTR